MADVRPARSPRTMRRRQRKTYHHGILPAALVAAAKALIIERGLDGFTLREAARRVGVTHVAAYRHYSDRRALLAAVSESGFHKLHRRRAAAVQLLEPPADRPREVGEIGRHALEVCLDPDSRVGRAFDLRRGEATLRLPPNRGERRDDREALRRCALRRRAS
jgi:AcrR family transcriptional regulator